MSKDKPRSWYSEWHEQSMHPTSTVHEQERPTLYLPDGREVVARPALGFRPQSVGRKQK